MKGIIIFEDFKKLINCKEILDGNYNCVISDYPEGTFGGVINRVTGARCNKDDTYDFETGALIALMKMCGLEKSAKAYAEMFDDTAYGDALIERDKLKEENKRLKAEKDLSWKNYQRKIQKKQDRINELEAQITASEDDKQKNIEYYEKEIKNLKGNIDELFESDKYSKSLVGKLSFEKHRLEEENEKLQHEYNLCLNSENALKYTVDSLNKSVDKLNKAIVGYKNDLYNTAKRCKELERGYKASNDDEAKLVEYYQREIKKLEAENEKLKDELRLKEDAINEWKQTLRERNEKIGDLVCENYKLKTDCEKLQHGYVYTDMMICGGRQNGKQFTFLVDLFKKIDQKKVDAAYKEAYNTTLPVWQKEVFKQIYKDQLASLLEASKYAMPTEFTFKINQVNSPTKREKMWVDIKNSKIGSIKVEKAFINDFLSEAEENGLVWANGSEKPTEWDRWENWRRHDYIVFRIWNCGKTKELTWGDNGRKPQVFILRRSLLC